MQRLLNISNRIMSFTIVSSADSLQATYLYRRACSWMNNELMLWAVRSSGAGFVHSWFVFIRVKKAHQVTRGSSPICQTPPLTVGKKNTNTKTLHGYTTTGRIWWMNSGGWNKLYSHFFCAGRLLRCACWPIIYGWPRYVDIHYI